MGRRAALAAVALLLSAFAGAGAEEPIERGDRWWTTRAEGAHGGRAAAEPIRAAVVAYEQGVTAEPARLEGYWKLVRALYFEGEYVATDIAAKREVFDRGRRVAEEGLDRLGERVGGRKQLDRLTPDELAERFADDDDVIGLYFWGSVCWGLWGDAFGRFAAARQGVAGTIRDYSERVLAIDERYESGGGHRVLGRLHALAPRVPFFSGWIDRELAVEHLGRALEIGPQEPLNHLYLAEALLDHVPERRQEGRELLVRLRAAIPSPDQPVAWASAQQRAGELLARFSSDG